MLEQERERRIGTAGMAIHPPLVEREAALATIAAGLDSAMTGAGALVTVEGEAGIGKTRLLAESAAVGEDRGMQVLATRGTELERGFAFGVVRRLLGPRIAALDEDDVAPLIEGAAAPAVDLLRDTPVGMPPPDRLFAIVNGLYLLCDHLARARPALILVDDLHWADAPSAQAVAHLAAHIEDTPIALIVAIRAGHELAADPRASTADASGAGITVRGLSEAGTLRVLQALLGSAGGRFSAAVHEASAGNPFLVREVAVTVAREGLAPLDANADGVAGLAPDAVGGWVARRLDGLSGEARALGRSLAVLERAEIGVAAAVAQLSEWRAREAADELGEAFLIDRSLPLQFSHPLVRTAVHAAIPPGSRDDAHHRAAAVLRERGAAAEAVVTHLLASEPRGEDWAVAALRSAAAIAIARGASEQAARILERARAEPGAEADAELMLSLGEARVAASDPSARECLKAAASAPEPELRARALGRLAQVLYLSGDIEGAFETVEQALETESPGHGGAVEAELLVSYVLAGRQAPQLVAKVQDVIGRPRHSPPGVPPLAEIVRRHGRALDALMRGDRPVALSDSRWVAGELLSPTIAERAPSLLAVGPAFVLAGLGAYTEAEAIIDRLLTRARRRGSRLETAEALNERIWLRWRRGYVSGVLADAETVLDLTEEAWDVSKVPLQVARGVALVARGDLDRAAAALAMPADLERRLPGTWGWVWLPYGRAVVALARRSWDDARALAEEAGRRAAEIDAESPEWLQWRPVAALAAAGAGDRDPALRIALEDLDDARAIDSPRAIGIALATCGVVQTTSDGIRLLGDSLDLLDGAQAELEASIARLGLGMALRRNRRAREARTPLRESLDAAVRLGATGVAERALAELRAAAGRPRRQRTTGISALTPREREVGELAGAGLSNPEIAERLFVTRKTVEGHLRTIFRKLGVSARGELAAALPPRPV